MQHTNLIYSALSSDSCYLSEKKMVLILMHLEQQYQAHTNYQYLILLMIELDCFDYYTDFLILTG